ncbi:MAG: AarF/ABC1/UbiB kinase family protein [archaeon]
MWFKKKLNSMKRLKQIVEVLFSKELGFVIERLKLKTHLTLSKKIQQSKFKNKPKSMSITLRQVMEELGATFVKLGQLLSLRTDFLPKEYCEEFAKLQDDVLPFEYSQVKKIVEKEFGKPIIKIFKEFEKIPIASASVGQVHRAKLKNGKVVAVKVQRPGIQNTFQTDIELLFELAKLAENYMDELKQYDLKNIVEEFERYTRKELDYKLEGKNIDTFYAVYKYNKYIKIPKVYWDYTTSKVLTMEFMEGVKISEIKSFEKLKSNRKTICKLLTQAFIVQTLEYGVFHADPHPGNIFVQKNNQIALLDFGIIGRLTPDMKESLGKIFIGLIKHDLDTLTQGFLDVGMVEGDIDIKRFKEDLYESLSYYYNISLKQTNMGNFFYDVFALARRYNMKFPTNFVLLIKAMVTTEGFCKKLDPNFNFVQVSRSYAEDLVSKRKAPGYLLKSVKRTALGFKDVMQNLPQDIRKITTMIQKGTLVNVDINNEDIKRFTIEMDRSSNRLTFGLIIAALIVAASLITLTNMPPFLLGLPFLSWFALGLVGILSLLLIFSILRENKGGE